MSNERYSRTHEERVSALWTAFGVCKERAVQSGKVNDCSLNKVTALASIPKTYLTGVRQFKNKDITKKYTEVNKAIQKWRSEFKASAGISEERRLINELTVENKNLKDSVQPLLERLDLLESLGDTAPKSLAKREEEILILRDQLRIAQSTQSYDDKVKEFGIASSVARRIISPDVYRNVGGRYEFGDAENNQKVMNNAYDELDKALSRNLKMRLYVLVGLPCSGKTTWAERATMYPDRHPVVFDATSLTRVDRLQLIHQVKRFDDLPICCVVFETPMPEIRKRNIHNRTADRQIPDNVLDTMNTRFEKPDPYKEDWIQEMIVVRP